MSHSVLVKVTAEEIPGKKYFLYINSEEGLTTLSENNANTLAEILNGYPDTFSEIEVLPRTKEEVILLEPSESDSIYDAFDFPYVFDECDNLQDLLQDNFDETIQGISLDETKRLLDKNN
ncbi:hypothetical protein [Flavobacterium sp. GSB-24]|uniref:hypothetical protein n=1 Tax=Flavobacterium sp. GSB-24 TaxID=2994319 RepID=UPI00248F7AAD|nr:hypothetical protein [Flavobacterium sp. GSB-24]BDU27699.1 hypothetical protein FLGSB24_44430 [Flavobacterium sp. GSB-24]